MKRANGFTLIEVIIIIVLSALIAAVVVPFMGTAITRSSEPVILMRGNLAVNQVISKIMADYQNEISNGTLDLAAFRNKWLLHSETVNEVKVNVEATFIEFQKISDAYTDTNADGIYDPVDKGATETGLLLVTAANENKELGNHKLSVIIGDYK